MMNVLCCACLLPLTCAPTLFAFFLILLGVADQIGTWQDMKSREVLIAEIGIILITLSLLWMFMAISWYQELGYFRFFAPSRVGLVVTTIGLIRMQRDLNLAGYSLAYLGIVLFLFSFLWIGGLIPYFSQPFD